MYDIPFSKNEYCIKLYFEFDCLGCFSQIFAPKPKNRSRVPMFICIPLKLTSTNINAVDQDMPEAVAHVPGRRFM